MMMRIAYTRGQNDRDGQRHKNPYMRRTVLTEVDEGMATAWARGYADKVRPTTKQVGPY